MTDLIILHGAWHQPAHYDDLAGRLRAQGMSVEVPDLYELSLEDGATLVQDIVSAAARPPLVLGHSFGGVTAGMVSGAAGLIFLTSWLLDVGESPVQLLDEVANETGASAEGLVVEPDRSGRLAIVPADARKKLFGDVEEAVAARAVKLLRPEPPSIFGATPTHVSWHDTPSIYIAGRNDHTIATQLISRFAARCTTSQTWETGHSPYLSHPAAVVDLVERWQQNG